MDRQYKFKLISETSPIPLQKFQLSDKKVMAGINFGSFFLSDDLVSPYVAFYNLLVTNGQILQPPSNSRSALSTHDGDLGLILTASSGIVKVGGNSFTWSCSKNRHSSDLIVYGMSDLTIVKSSQRNGTSKRKIVEDTRFIKCNIDELFVVVKLNDGIPVVSEITKNVVDLTKCAYTLKGHASLFAKCSVGMTISCLEGEGLSDKERALLRFPDRLKTAEDAKDVKEMLLSLDFVRCEGGSTLMGREEGLPCTIEGQRRNETPQREFEVPPFYIAKYTITNADFELFDPKHSRTNTSKGDRNPATCITYGRAVGFANWLSKQSGLAFSLPTEPQYVSAVAPYGWEYPHKEAGNPDRRIFNNYNAFVDAYPEGEIGATLEVDDPRVPLNHLGLSHATGNVSIFTLGHYPTPGHWGSNSDGSYAVVVGGNFRLCPFGTRSVTRGIIDITGIFDTIGIRLVHPDPNYLLNSR